MLLHEKKNIYVCIMYMYINILILILIWKNIKI